MGNFVPLCSFNIFYSVTLMLEWRGTSAVALKNKKRNITHEKKTPFTRLNTMFSHRPFVTAIIYGPRATASIIYISFDYNCLSVAASTSTAATHPPPPSAPRTIKFWQSARVYIDFRRNAYYYYYNKLYEMLFLRA